MGTQDKNMARLKDIYTKEVAPALMKQWPQGLWVVEWLNFRLHGPSQRSNQAMKPTFSNAGLLGSQWPHKAS